MITVTIVGIQTSGNLGAIARSMANFGVKQLYLVNPECEVLNIDSKSRAVRAVKILENAKIISSLDEVKADYLIATSAKKATGSNLNRVYLSSIELAKHLDNNLHYSIVIGREDSGLLNKEIAKCDLIVNIPSSEEYPTLNISHALNIILYELFKTQFKIKHVANKRERKAVLMRLRQISSNVIKYDNFEKIFENIINRAFIRKKEARALAGLFKKIKE